MDTSSIDSNSYKKPRDSNKRSGIVFYINKFWDVISSSFITIFFKKETQKGWEKYNLWWVSAPFYFHKIYYIFYKVLAKS